MKSRKLAKGEVQFQLHPLAVYALGPVVGPSSAAWSVTSGIPSCPAYALISVVRFSISPDRRDQPVFVIDRDIHVLAWELPVAATTAPNWESSSMTIFLTDREECPSAGGNRS